MIEETKNQQSPLSVINTSRTMNSLTTKPDTYYSACRKDMLKFVNVPVHALLEIGCGVGNFSSNYPDAEYWGVEPVAKQAELAASKSLKVLNGCYENVSSQIPDKYFDLIVCNDVIEHMTDPRAFLHDVSKKLNSTGVMIVSVPNLRNVVTLYNLLVKGEFQYTESGILDYTHFHLFTKHSLIQLAKECGWHVEICEPISPLPFKPIKDFLLCVIKLLIPEIKSAQIGARLRPAFPSDNKDSNTNISIRERNVADFDTAP